MKRYLACCGLYCGACVSILLQEKEEGNIDLQQFTWNFDEQACPGCSAGANVQCGFTACCARHGVESCAFCAEFPCKEILSFAEDEWPHHREVMDNLIRIKEIATEAWLQEQAKKWACPSCKTKTHWYQNKCHKCGAEWEASYQIN